MPDGLSIEADLDALRLGTPLLTLVRDAIIMLAYRKKTLCCLLYTVLYMQVERLESTLISENDSLRERGVLHLAQARAEQQKGHRSIC